jgi:hypothetical protein
MEATALFFLVKQVERSAGANVIHVPLTIVRPTHSIIEHHLEVTLPFLDRTPE